MAVQEIISRIKQDAHKQADTEVADAREKASTFRREFDRELEKKKAALQREMETTIKSRASIIVSEARREARDNILRVKESIIQESVNEALTTLRELPEEQYRALLIDLITKAQQQLGGQCILAFTRSQDKELIGGSSEFDMSEEIVPGSGGVIVYSQDRRLRVNNTFEGILARKRREIRNLAARMLFSR